MYRIVLFYLLLSSSLYAESKTSLLTGIARDTIVGNLTDQKLYDKKALIKAYPYLSENGATFVTLNENKRLRGCIGSLTASRPLINDLISNSRSAAFSDPRFLPLKRKELSRLEVEVSVLTPPERILYDSIDALRKEVVAGRDGIVLKTFLHKATYLPQVWEDIPDFEQFFFLLCEKAGLERNCLKDHPNIYRYRVDKYSEDDLSRRPASNAGLFYPQECLGVEHQLSSFRNRAQRQKRAVSEHTPRAIIVPHAGYIYSGYTANLAYTLAQKSSAKRVIVIGPSHGTAFQGLSVAKYEAVQTPCGLLRIDESYIKELGQIFSLGFVEKAHISEHSTEVQFPFINHYMPEKKVIEIIYGQSAKEKLRRLMVYLLEDPDNLLIVSSDLSHYYAKKTAHQKDFICLDAVEQIDSRLLKSGCEACGSIGIEALLEAAKTVQLKSGLLDYRTSADTNKDNESVVGYMSAFFW
ncbi:MAG: AmmeMemoRadiSam system protein B [Helicobacteraceae bacterium]|jgi:AmmeMemoRadiSam system protein B/AmmeMemoRadiSam system protein A|nr:AmmeMemoRadiSam system protein B [Helicobacteraceae bacterium]